MSGGWAHPEGHIMGLRRQRTGGWAVGVVHARVRHGEHALELRKARHFATLETALEALRTPLVLRGHGGTGSQALGGTAGQSARDQVLRDLLADPWRTLRDAQARTGITQEEWSRRSGVPARTIRKIINEGEEPLVTTAHKLLEALQ